MVVLSVLGCMMRLWSLISGCSGMADPGPSAADVALVHRSLKALGSPAASRVVKKLSVGASGSQVFSLELEGGRAVLEVTEDPGWRVRAERGSRCTRSLRGR